MDLIFQYILFLTKTITFVAAIAVVLFMIFYLRHKKGEKKGELEVVNLSEQYKESKEEIQLLKLNDEEQKFWLKAKKKQHKEEVKQKKQRAKDDFKTERKPNLFVLNFKGSTDAMEVEALREEVTAILSIADEHDEVLLKLESPGGVVHGYGLAASQLDRLKKKGLMLTVVVDKVAASGGYMMACVANKIVAAPFAIIGSIGVVAQLPNIHRLLKKNDIDIELHTAGEYKRTLTMLGENTEKGREKFIEDLNDVHDLFKAFVSEHRPSLVIDLVATGEYWFGTQAIEKGLIDEISTSDDLLFAEVESRNVYSVTFVQRKKLLDRVSCNLLECSDRLMLRWLQRSQRPLL